MEQKGKKIFGITVAAGRGKIQPKRRNREKKSKTSKYAFQFANRRLQIGLRGPKR